MIEKTRFKPENALTFETVLSTRQDFHKKLLEDTSGTICLDLSSITQCDSAGLALLIEAKKLCKQHNKFFEILEMPSKTRALAEFCGVQNLLYES